MKKILISLLVITLFATTGCSNGGEELDVAETFEKMALANVENQGIVMDGALSVEMTDQFTGKESMEAKFESVMNSGKNLGELELSLEANVAVDIDGEKQNADILLTVAEQQFYIDATTNESIGQLAKIKFDMKELLGEQMNIDYALLQEEIVDEGFYDEYDENLKATKKGNEIIIEFKDADIKEFNKLIKEYYDESLTVTIDALNYKTVLNADYTYKSSVFDYGFTVTDGENRAELSMELTGKADDKASVKVPENAAEYIDFVEVLGSLLQY